MQRFSLFLYLEILEYLNWNITLEFDENLLCIFNNHSILKLIPLLNAKIDSNKVKFIFHYK